MKHDYGQRKAANDKNNTTSRIVHDLGRSPDVFPGRRILIIIFNIDNKVMMFLYFYWTTFTLFNINKKHDDFKFSKSRVDELVCG